LVAGFLLSSCAKKELYHFKADFTGVYTLITLNRNPVPVSFIYEGAILRVRSGAFTFYVDGTCNIKTTFVSPSGTEFTREMSALYTKKGSELIMQWKGAGKTVGTIDGNTITMDNEGMVFVYRK
jgi:hypothetical protein